MSDISDKEKLSEEEVNQTLKAWNFLEFSRNYSNTFYNSYNTPDTINQQMQNISMNPVNTSIEDIKKALNNPKTSEEILRNYATQLENENMYYKRLIRYIADLPAFNMTFDCININSLEEYNSIEYKLDLKEFEDFQYKFNAKEQLTMVLIQLLREGVYYTNLREEGDKYVLQQLPPNYCKITGHFNHGLLFDFDFSWFMSNMGVDIDMYPKVFKRMYSAVFKKISEEYNPASSINNRNSTFAYWHQCSPNDNFWAWKISPEVTTLIPYFAPLFPDIAMQPIVRGLQEDKYFIEATKMLVGIIGFNKDTKSGVVANQTKMSPEFLGQFLGIARQGLKKQIGLTALPMDSVETVEFNTKDRNMLTEHVKNITDQSVASSASLLDDNKLNVHQSKLASAIDVNFVKSMYPMFESFMEFFINRRTKKYKFKITFNDFNTPDDFSKRKELSEVFNSKGATNWELMARLNDKNLFQYKKQIMNENILFADMPELFLQLQNIYTQSNNDTLAQKGRPKAEDTENDSTLETQDDKE